MSKLALVFGLLEAASAGSDADLITLSPYSPLSLCECTICKGQGNPAGCTYFAYTGWLYIIKVRYDPLDQSQYAI